MLTEAQIAEFRDIGVLVVPNVLTKDEINTARSGLHAELKLYGVDHDNLAATAHNLKRLSSTGGAGGILDLFYPSWRLKVAENSKVFDVISDLWDATYARATEPRDLFYHPFGAFPGKQGFMYINRVCYRVPDIISNLPTEGVSKKRSKTLQRSLTPHVDCCPTNLYESGKAFPRWRPIQCITVLTPNLEPSTGGFEAVRGFHKEFSRYFASSPPVESVRPPVCLGDFSPLRMQEDKQVIARYEHIPCDAGSVILFDWRIPHANSYRHVGTIPREVIYTGFLPNVPMNQIYAKEQLRRYTARLLPADHWQKGVEDKAVDETFSPHEFTPLGRQLMAIDPWNGA
ncbi:hypothetical protein AeMF1_015120 [Aphanomyces euteiches]|nr:hypothetical protein AeMF1_015120 [Aphanomyces euteiches]